MDYSNFVGQVQNKARLDGEDKAVRAIRATLETLSERLSAGEVSDAASQLPREIALYMQSSDGSERFDVDEFFRRVSHREQVDLPEAIFHARAVVEVLDGALSEGEMSDIRAQLPEDYSRLFDSGSTGKME